MVDRNFANDFEKPENGRPNPLASPNRYPVGANPLDRARSVSTIELGIGIVLV